jgi:peptide/nickel transport system permease protein
VLRFVLRRLALMVPVLLGLSILLFVWVRSLPGDGPARSLLGPRATPERIDAINEAYGFNDPLLEQYFRYVGSLLRGDFLSSINDGDPVLDSFLDKLPVTVELSLAALLFAIVVGIPLGYAAARFQNRPPDTAVVSLSLLGVATPVFFLALLLKLVFANWLGWLPATFRQTPGLDATEVTGFAVLDGLLTREYDAAWDAVQHLILPGIALGTIPLAIVVRITRASVAEVLQEDYVRTAESKGLSRLTVSRRHVLRNAMLPVATTIGLQTGLLFSGAVLTETVFGFQGIGAYLFDAITRRDYPVLQGYIIFIAIMYSLINLVVDLLYGVIDPRVRVAT